MSGRKTGYAPIIAENNRSVTNDVMIAYVHEKISILGTVCQSVVSLTSSLRVISLTVLADSVYNILIFFVKNVKISAH